MHKGSVGRGIGIGAVLTLMGLAAMIVLAFPILGGLLVAIGIGLVQLLWMLPAILHYRGRGETETVKGLMIVGGLVILLNAPCWGAVLSGNFKYGG
jgi:hypothetical protein